MLNFTIDRHTALLAVRFNAVMCKPYATVLLCLMVDSFSKYHIALEYYFIRTATLVHSHFDKRNAIAARLIRFILFDSY